MPYDFVRKRLSVVVAEEAQGAAPADHQGRAGQRAGGVHAGAAKARRSVALDDAHRAQIQQRFAAWSGQGFRVLGVATRRMAPQPPTPATTSGR